MPSESATARTTSLRVQLPTDTPFAFVSVKPVPGWTATTTTTPLDPPVEAEGLTITEAVSEVTWTADPGGGPAPGEYQTFSISVGPLPEDATRWSSRRCRATTTAPPWPGSSRRSTASQSRSTRLRC